jgi:uncharacterized coiled-coil protein SlyX
MSDQLIGPTVVKEKMEDTLRLLGEMVSDVSGFQSAVGQLSERMAQARKQVENMEARLDGLALELDDVKPCIMLLYADLADPETSEIRDTRVGVFSNDWIIAESSDGDQEFGRLSMEAVEVMSYNLSQSLGVKEVVKRVTLNDDFPHGSFEWDIALDALHDQESKQAAPKMGM